LTYTLVGQGLLTSRLHDHTQIHPNRQESSGRVISLTHRPLLDIKQQSLETDIHALSGIRTRNPSKQAAAEPSLRPCGHRDRPNGRMSEYNQVVRILRKQFRSLTSYHYKICRQEVRKNRKNLVRIVVLAVGIGIGYYQLQRGVLLTIYPRRVE